MGSGLLGPPPSPRSSPLPSPQPSPLLLSVPPSPPHLQGLKGYLVALGSSGQFPTGVEPPPSGYSKCWECCRLQGESKQRELWGTG